MADEPNIELINDKWQNVLPQYESNRFDLAIVDPPYGNDTDVLGIANGNTHAAQRKDYKEYDNKAPDKAYFDELFRVSKEQIVWGGNFFGLEGGYICWNKNGTVFGQGELAYCSMQNSVSIYEFTWNGMLQGDMSNKEERVHPQQKPVALYRWLLTKYANPGDTILDTHLGSGSSAIAACQKKHDFVGIECDKEYFDDMLHRYKKNTDPEYALQAWQEQSESEGQQTIFSNK